MKKLIKYTSLLLALLFAAGTFTNLQAQDDDDDKPELNLWMGGDINVDFGLNMNLVGGGSGSSMMGGVISNRVDNGAASIFTNPASLGFQKKRSFIMDGRLGLGNWSVGSVNDEILETINDEISSGSSDIVEDPDNFFLQDESFVQYSTLNNLRAGLPQQLGSFSVAWPLHDLFTLGFGYTRPVDLNLRLQTSGFSTKIGQNQGTDDVSLRFDVLMNISSLVQFSLRMNSISYGFGSKLYDGRYGTLAVGANLQRYQVENLRNINTDLSGMVVVGNADERFFNNPLDPNLNFEAGESNNLFFQANALMKDEQTGYKIGMVYRFKFIDLSVTYQDMPEFNLSDEGAKSSAFLPVFIPGYDILGGDLEIDADSLIPSIQANKANLTTERDISGIVSPSSFKLPSSLTVGLDIAMGRSTMSLNYTNYQDNLEFVIDGDTYGYVPEHGVGFGLNIAMSDKFKGTSVLLLPIRLLYLDIDGLLLQSFKRWTKYKNPQYAIGGSVMLGSRLEGGEDNFLNDAMDLPLLPTGFSMGRRYTIFDSVTVGTNIIAVPDLLFRFSVGYTF